MVPHANPLDVVHGGGGDTFTSTRHFGKWMEHGKTIELNEVRTYFGSVTLHVTSNLEKGVINAVVRSNSERKPQSIRLRLPHPEGRKPQSVTGFGARITERETVTIDNFNGRVEIQLHY